MTPTTMPMMAPIGKEEEEEDPGVESGMAPAVEDESEVGGGRGEVEVLDPPPTPPPVNPLLVTLVLPLPPEPLPPVVPLLDET